MDDPPAAPSRREEIRALSHGIRDVHGRLGTLQDYIDRERDRMDSGDAEALEEALEVLSVTLEELEVSSEELHVQNRELHEAWSQVAQERERYRELFDLAPEAYLTTDEHGMIRMANRRASALLGRARHRLEGQPLASTLSPEDRRDMRTLIARASTGSGVHNWELDVTTKGGAESVLASIEPSTGPDGEPELRWVLSDAAPVVHARRTLQRLLEDSQGDTASLRVVTEWQASLLGAAAHDLNTPLHVISSTLQSLLDQVDTLPPEEERPLLERAANQAMRLRRLLPSLLQMGQLQLQSGTPRRRVVGMAQLFDEVLMQLMPLEHEITCQFEARTVHADPLQLERVLFQLLSNATRHAPEGTTIRVGTIVCGVDVELFVDDQGPNVPPEEREAVFSPFLRIQRGDDDPDGPGLGLALVSMFARMHGGRAWIEDAPGGGASFRVRISNGMPDTHGPDTHGPDTDQDAGSEPG